MTARTIQPMEMPVDIEALLQVYGNDPLNYLSLSPEKKHFTGVRAKGFISFVVINRVALCLGDPICDPEQIAGFIDEFRHYCRKKRWKIALSSVSTRYVQAFESCGLRLVKYGEEAVIDLETYVLSGKKTIKLRNKISQAGKAGLRVIEYEPAVRRDWSIEEQIDEVSAEWFADKKARLTFSLGELHLDNPMKRRYFVSFAPDGTLHAVLMFSPYEQGKGYFLDVMRRRKTETYPGVMEHAIISAMMKMKEEGVRTVSLGMVPLAGVGQSCDNPWLSKLYRFIFCHVKSDYGFESLYHYKKKFGPEWHERYIAYDAGIPLFKVWFVMIKARKVKGAFQQFAKGLWDLVKRKQHRQSKETDIAVDGL